MTSGECGPRDVSIRAHEESRRRSSINIESLTGCLATASLKRVCHETSQRIVSAPGSAQMPAFSLTRRGGCVVPAGRAHRRRRWLIAFASTDGVESRAMADSRAPRTRYRSITADSSRWDGFAFRPGDVVISTPPKSGTTWTQMLCALLIFDGPQFPALLGEVSPWLDICTQPLAEVTAALIAQTHRRFIKTHTPLDGLPLRADVTYLVVGRDPRDVAVSWEHHAANMDFARFLELRAEAVGNEDLAELPERPVPSADLVERFRTFVSDETAGGPTLASVLHHLDTGWHRRHDPTVALF